MVELAGRGHEVVATAREVAMLEGLPAVKVLPLDVSDGSLCAAVEAAGELDAELVSAAVADAIEDPATPVHVEVGKDAGLVLHLRRTLDDAQFEATMREALGLTR